MRASPPALLAAGRLIVDSREELVAEWANRLGDRITAAPTIPRSMVERELRLLVDILAQMIGPLRREARPMWRRACEQYGRNASTRGLSAGEVVEELLHLRDILTRRLAPVVAAMRARQGMAILLRLNRVLDHGIAAAVVGYTDALVATMLGRNGVPEQGNADEESDTRRWLETLEGELASISAAR